MELVGRRVLGFLIAPVAATLVFTLGSVVLSLCSGVGPELPSLAELVELAPLTPRFILFGFLLMGPIILVSVLMIFPFLWLVGWTGVVPSVLSGGCVAVLIYLGVAFGSPMAPPVDGQLWPCAIAFVTGAVPGAILAHLSFR